MSPNNATGATLSKQRLFVVVHKGVAEDAIARLFRRFPGMEYCDLKKDRATGKSKVMPSQVHSMMLSPVDCNTMGHVTAWLWIAFLSKGCLFHVLSVMVDAEHGYICAGLLLHQLLHSRGCWSCC